MSSDGTREQASASHNTAKGIRISVLNAIAIALTLAFGLALITITQAIDETSKELKDSVERYITCEQAASSMKDAETYLTSRACAFVATHDTAYLKQYFTEVNDTQRKEQAAKQVEAQLTSDAAQDYLRAALICSNSLQKREYYAMRLAADAAGVEIPDYAKGLESRAYTATDTMLTDEEKQQRAESLLFDNQYQIMKTAVESNITACVNELIASRELDQSTASDRLSTLLTLQEIITVLLMLAVLAVIGTVVGLVLRPLNSYTSFIKRGGPLNLAGSRELRFLAHAYNDMYKRTQTSEASLRHQAEHDPLTDLLNRNAYDALRRDKTGNRALLLIDVDHFKQVNDTYGHDTGDRILKKVARALKRSFRATDYPYRIGGDEFAVIMEDVTPDERPVIERKIASMSQIMADDSDGLPSVTISVGVSFTQDIQGKDLGLYKAADLALYAVKDKGRNGHAFYRDVEQKHA